MEYKVAPSLLAADFTRLGEQVHEIEEAGAPYLQWMEPLSQVFLLECLSLKA